jgi:hypothetical protein
MKEMERSKSRRTEITIAIIGLLGILATAVFSNWDKIFSKVIQESYTGYRPTDNFETELRYYFDVSGVRATAEIMQQQLISEYKMVLITESPESAEKIDAIMSTVLEESPTLDEVIKKYMPVYRKYFTIEEIQRLNKFYSTETMQNLVKKLPLLTQEIVPLEIELTQDYLSRLGAKLDEFLDQSAEDFDVMVKNNMHTVQLAVEDYNILHEGRYPAVVADFRELLPASFTNPIEPELPAVVDGSVGKRGQVTYFYDSKMGKYKIYGFGGDGKQLSVVLGF